LEAKGIMYNALHVYKLGENEFAVGVIARGSPRRDLVAMIHQEMGASPKKVLRPFLGINSDIKIWASNRIKRWIGKQLKESVPKRLRITLS